ncbi:MAG TPA: MBL fold metallo-hydrolase [Acidimicrobiales bacterium]
MSGGSANGGSAHGHCRGASPSAARLHELVEGVHAWIQPDGTWWINNAGAVIGTGETMVIDTCATEERTRRFLAAVGEAADGRPIRVAANTHDHGDHTHGNCLLPSNAVLVGHESTRRRMLRDPTIDAAPRQWDPVPDWGKVSRRPPTIVTRSELTVYAGDRRVDLVHPGRVAHTQGDLVAWLPDERILFAGDLVFHGLTPLVFAGSVRGALESLDWLAGFGADWIVPGHGPIVGKAAVESVLADHERYYRFVLRTAERGRHEGLNALETAQQADLGEFAAWADAERLVLNLHRADAESAGGSMDVGRAFDDAMVWNGGPLTTHVCCGPDAAPPVV